LIKIKLLYIIKIIPKNCIDINETERRMSMQALNLTYGTPAEQVWDLTGSSTTANSGAVRIEHDECGDSAFYPLSPVQMLLYYSHLPEAACA
jgi:hypothetical protein